MKNYFKTGFCLLIFTFLAFGCKQKIPSEALQLSEQSLKFRQMQTRHFDASEDVVISASSAVLQDLGYNIDEAESELGVLVSSKTRDAREGGQIVGALIIAAFTGVAMPVDHTQHIRVSLITYPLNDETSEIEENCRTGVRVTFQRVVINSQGQVSRREAIEENEIYQEFFDKLSQSLFLEAHEL